MSSLLAKIAALRARRSATELLPTVIGPPGVVKHPTIADEREISDGDSSDEELMLISVTPPPKKLDAAGQRALWRERERERARQKTKRNLMEGGLYEMMTRKLEPERVEKVEAAAEDDEEEAEGEDVEEEEEDEEEAALEQVGWDEEGEEENFRDVGFRSALGEARDDEEKRAVEGGGESQKNATEVADGGDGGKGDEGAANRGRDMPSSKCVEEQTTSDGKVAEKTYATIADTSPISESPEEEGSPVTPASPVKSKSNLRDTPPPQNPFGMVDEEASDDEDTPEGEDTAMEHFANREEDEDDGIERGPTPQKSAERSKLATFHRRWELEREQQDVQTVAMGGRELDVDEAVDLTELMKRDVEVKDNFSEEGGVGITETGGGVGGGAGMDDASREHADNYMKAMFLRDDSKSKFAREDDEENANPEEEEGRRDKARALWRARQKFKDCVQQEDDNSLSRFDLFKDRDDNRSQEIRQRLERAIRPASKRDDEDKGKKRKSPWAQPESTVPEWKRRRACLEEKERKRAHAVSVGRWSFSSHAKKEGKAEKRDQGDGKKVKQTLGASHIVRKNRRREMPAPRKPPSRAGVQTSKPKKGPTTFKGLLSILGQQAKRSDQ